MAIKINNLVPNFKIRASSVHCIMTKDVNSSSLNNYVESWIQEHYYNIIEDWSNKYTLKGEECEEQALKMLGFKKNKRHFEDGYFMGTPDVRLKDEIIDTKCSWSIETLDKVKTLPMQYFYQMQVYMHLTKLKKARVMFVGVDTPIKFLTDEDKISDHQFIFLPKEERIKEFVVEYDSEAIQQIRERVLYIRLTKLNNY
jgi:hypothetical protein